MVLDRNLCCCVPLDKCDQLLLTLWFIAEEERNVVSLKFSFLEYVHNSIVFASGV
jgi:hypothetical protein